MLDCEALIQMTAIHPHAFRKIGPSELRDTFFGALLIAGAVWSLGAALDGRESRNNESVVGAFRTGQAIMCHPDKGSAKGASVRRSGLSPDDARTYVAQIKTGLCKVVAQP